MNRSCAVRRGTARRLRNIARGCQRQLAFLCLNSQQRHAPSLFLTTTECCLGKGTARFHGCENIM